MRTRHVVPLALALAVSACGESITSPDTGQVRFVLSAGSVAPATAPALSGDHEETDRPRFVSANVTFASILARNLDGVLVNIAMELPTTVDVAAMEERRAAVTLPDGELEPGTYDQIVVVMTEVQVETHDGTLVTIDPPGGGWTAIVPVCPFEVEGGATSVVGLELSVRYAFRWREGRFRFQPYFRCDTGDETETEG